MRRFFVAGLVLAGCLLGSTAVRASTGPSALTDDPSRAYWREAHNLTQEQVRLLDRVEQASQKPKTQPLEIKRLRTLSGQILLYTSAVDRFLKFNYPDSALLCSPPAGLGEFAGTDGASLEQVQVYCSLYRSTQDLMAMRTRIDYQARLLNPNQPDHHTSSQAIAPANAAAGVRASSREVLGLVQSSRQRLAQAQPAFPEALRISISQSTPTVPAQSADLR
ncbi:MAG: hypothetical protein C4288_13475 [Leptolyngbya sp. ERB_1_1]